MLEGVWRLFLFCTGGLVKGVVEALYGRAPVWAQNLALSCYGAHLYRLRYGAVQRACLQSLLQTQWQSAHELREFQNQAFIDLVRHAFAHVPFYRAFYAEHGVRHQDIQSLDDIGKLPFVTKEMVRLKGATFLSETVRRANLTTISTSGTTGTPLSLLFERSAIEKNYAFFARALNWGGVSVGERSATFAGRPIVPTDQVGPPFWRENLAFRNTLFSTYHLSSKNCPFYVEKLQQSQPRFIDSYPSALFVLAQYIQENGTSFSVQPRAIVTSSETLLPHQRELIERVFHTRIFDQYGSAEMAAFICQCEQGRYHVNPEFGIIEVLANNRSIMAGTGELVCTGFLNYAFPLIRYKIGDGATVSSELCRCGRHFPVISSIEGRMDDYIVTPDGKRVGRLDPIFKVMSSAIKEVQIIQRADGQLTINVAKGTIDVKAVEADINAMLAELRQRVGDGFRIHVEYMDSIRRERNGKFRAVVSELKR